MKRHLHILLVALFTLLASVPAQAWNLGTYTTVTTDMSGYYYITLMRKNNATAGSAYNNVMICTLRGNQFPSTQQSLITNGQESVLKMGATKDGTVFGCDFLSHWNATTSSVDNLVDVSGTIPVKYIFQLKKNDKGYTIRWCGTTTPTYFHGTYTGDASSSNPVATNDVQLSDTFSIAEISTYPFTMPAALSSTYKYYIFDVTGGNPMPLRYASESNMLPRFYKSTNTYGDITSVLALNKIADADVPSAALEAILLPTTTIANGLYKIKGAFTPDAAGATETTDFSAVDGTPSNGYWWAMETILGTPNTGHLTSNLIQAIPKAAPVTVPSDEALSVFQINANGNGTYNIKNVGLDKYLNPELSGAWGYITWSETPAQHYITLAAVHPDELATGTKYYEIFSTSNRPSYRHYRQGYTYFACTNNQETYSMWDVIRVFKLSIGATGYATAVFEKNVTLPEGITAYKASLQDNDKVTISEIGTSVVPANTPVVLSGTANTTCYVEESATAGAAISGNLLLGSATATATPGAVYVLTEKDGAAVFALTDASLTIPAGKAYLAKSGSSKSALAIVKGNPSSIKSAAIKDGAEAVYYDLQGRKVTNPERGIFIVNGKKVFIK